MSKMNCNETKLEVLKEPLPKCIKEINTNHGQVLVFDQKKTWNEAEDDCSGRRTHLFDLHYNGLVQTVASKLVDCINDQGYEVKRYDVHWQIGLSLKDNLGIWSDGEPYDIENHIQINSTDGNEDRQYVTLLPSKNMLFSSGRAAEKLSYLCSELPNKGFTVIMSVFGVICLLMIPILLLKIFYKSPKKKLLDVEHTHSDDSLSDFPKPLFDDDDDFYHDHDEQQELNVPNEMVNEEIEVEQKHTNKEGHDHERQVQSNPETDQSSLDVEQKKENKTVS